MSLHDHLARLLGWPPYDQPSNHCRDDAYYAKWIEEQYGKSIDELLKEDANDNRR